MDVNNKMFDADERLKRLFLVILLLAEGIVFVFLFSFFFVDNVFAVVGENNVTVLTNLTVGNVPPEVLSVTINGGNPISLAPNSTTSVLVYAVLRDYNGEGDIANVTAEFFDNVASSYGAADDNNDHYTNGSCSVNTGYGDQYEANASCYFSVQYYANNATWNATVFVNDTASLNGTNSTTIGINILLALGLPSVIEYGVVDAESVSNETEANVTNFGNVMFNLTLEGYGITEGDNLSMDCTLGNVGNISIGYEKFNLTSSNTTSPLALAQFEGIYENLTSDAVTKTYNLNYRQNDVTNEAFNSTYWRIYVPLGVAGTCNGSIIFGATQAAGT